MIKNIKILEHNITVERSTAHPNLKANNLGFADAAKTSITLNTELAKDAEDHTLLHEIVHLIAFMQGIELKEQDVDGLSLGILSLIRNNKQLINEINKR